MSNFQQEEERFTDPLDAASHLADLHNQASVEKARAKAAPDQVKNADGTWPITHCIEPDCDEELGPVRLLMGSVRCMPCQAHKEKMEARRGRY